MVISIDEDELIDKNIEVLMNVQSGVGEKNNGKEKEEKEKKGKGDE